MNKVKAIFLQPHSLLFTMNINDLYTNIDNNMGLKVIKQCLSQNPGQRNRGGEQKGGGLGYWIPRASWLK